jgi:hypothetical protein
MDQKQLARPAAEAYYQSLRDALEIVNDVARSHASNRGTMGDAKDQRTELLKFYAVVNQWPEFHAKASADDADGAAAEPKTGADGIAQAREFIQGLDFRSNPERKTLKKSALDALQKAEEALKAGRSPKDDLDEATKELEALSSLGLKNPANADRVKSALEAIATVKASAD